jgi:hypothetical protein
MAGYRIASWREVEDWARSNGIPFDGNINPVNTIRRAQGKKPYAILKGPIQAGLRLP